MTPRYFSEPQHRAVEQSLERLGIDDEEGVRVFVIALEYELAEYEKRPLSAATAQPEVIAQPSGALTKVCSVAAELAVLLQALPDNERATLLREVSASDPFRRNHEAAYLAAMVDELTRISNAGRALSDGQPSTAVIDPDAAHFVRAVAEAYYECFEARPTENHGEPFFSLLRDIIEISGLQIELDADALMQLLR